MVDGYNGRAAEGFWSYGEDGKVILTPMDDGTRTVPGQSSFYYCPGDLYFSKFEMPSHRIEKTSYCEAYEAAGVIEKNSHDILTKLVTKTVDEAIELDLLKAEIDKYAQEAITGFIVKGVTDDTWATYQKTLNNLRLADYVGVYQQAYDRYLEANK